MLDDLKLKVAGSHLGLKALIGDELDRTVEFERTLGNRNLIVPGLPKEMTASRAAWRQAAATFNEVAAGLRPHAMRTGYHNHLVEFKSLEGEEPWDTFFSNASPDVIMQVDVGNALAGGGDPIPCISRYPGRARTVHLKEHSRTNDRAIISEGDVRWDELFRLCESVGGTEWYIVEQESYAYPPLTCVAKCLEALKKMGK
jgi:sugar phosphate isomerase/epimerase